MSCHPKQTLVRAAVCALIQELVSACEARRRARRVACPAARTASAGEQEVA